MEFTLFILRWIHFLAGITWIGILYYFNFVQTPFFAETEAPVRVGAIQKLVPRALWWLRWGAMITFLAGLLMYVMRMGEMGPGLFYSSSYGVAITVGGLIGTIMFLNVWLVIWPNQQIVIASTNQVASGGQALPAAAGAARHYSALVGSLGAFSPASHASFWFLVIVLVAAFEANALIGTQGIAKQPLDSVKGALWYGFLLTGILFLLNLGLT